MAHFLLSGQHPSATAQHMESRPHDEGEIQVTPHKQIKIAALAVPLMVIAAPQAGASPAVQDWQGVDAITQSVAHALNREAAPIDRRIKLAKCPEQPVVTAMDSGSLAVRCAPLGWRLRVGMTIAAGMQDQPAFFAPPSAAQRGKSAPPTVRRGDVVRISIETPNYSVSYPATAIQDGRLGEAIALRGLDAKNSIIAVVTGPGRAHID